jgi:hypothetical protein
VNVRERGSELREGERLLSVLIIMDHLDQPVGLTGDSHRSNQSGLS